MGKTEIMKILRASTRHRIPPYTSKLAEVHLLMHDTATLKDPDQLRRAQSARGTSSIGSNAVCKHNVL